MSKTYKTVAGYGEDEFIVSKSRFIGYVNRAETEEEALEFIQKIKEMHKTATHNVYAYIIGEAGILQRFSDDGEPSGTAGIPALEVLKKEDLKNVVVVVTRYFGGVKLGGGGLVRAYSKSAKIAVDSGIIVDMTPFERIRVEISYTAYGKLENYLRDKGISPEETSFGDDVSLEVYIDSEDLDLFQSELNDMTSGTVKLTFLGESMLPVRDGERLQNVGI
ncbi:MAG: YigZ family protein [Gudongella sp.]|jgi:uncharacterized YigZ family protein|nr:YigZ family protein [Gudongella sp.]